MAKKLKVELEVDNSDAKKKAKEVAETAAGRSGGPPPPTPPSMPAPAPAPTPARVASTPAEMPLSQGTPPPTPSADVKRANDSAAKAAKDAADGLEKAGRSARTLSNGAEESAHSIKDIARSFAGLGVGMSMRFAHQFVKEGSFADKALTVGESAANLGFMGAKMGGPWGAAIGTIVGAGKGYMESEKADADRMKAEAEQKSANMDAINSWRQAREATLAFKATLDALTDSETSLAERQRKVAEEIKRREAAHDELSRAAIREGSEVTKPDGTSNAEAFAKSMEKLKENAARLDQLKDLQKRLEKEKEKPETPRPSFDAPDALARIGGAFAPSGNNDMRDLARTGREQLDVLRSIERKSGKDATWQ